jgi:hypothetical protein
MARKVRRWVLFFSGGLMLLFGATVIFRWVSWQRWPVHIKDGFEGPKLSSVWSASKMVPVAFSTESEIVRSGSGAGKITVRSKDRFEGASADGPASEREELMEAPWYWSRTGWTYDYRFSLYLPRDFPIVKVRLVIAQWIQLCEWFNCLPDNPVLAIRYVGGVLYVTRKNDDGQLTMYRSDGEMRGKWMDFRFITRFSPADDGFINGWMNGRKIAEFHGVTAYRAAWGYPAHGFFYFKMGLYRDLMREPMTIYFDDFRKDQCGAPTCNQQEAHH